MTGTRGRLRDDAGVAPLQSTVMRPTVMRRPDRRQARGDVPAGHAVVRAGRNGYETSSTHTAHKAHAKAWTCIRCSDSAASVSTTALPGWTSIEPLEVVDGYSERQRAYTRFPAFCTTASAAAPSRRSCMNDPLSWANLLAIPARRLSPAPRYSLAVLAQLRLLRNGATPQIGATDDTAVRDARERWTQDDRREHTLERESQSTQARSRRPAVQSSCQLRDGGGSGHT
jgi:hypothetical protein